MSNALFKRFVKPMLQLENILLARDFSPSSDRALCYAVDLARQTGSTIHLLYVQVLDDLPFGSAAADQSGQPEDHIRERLLRDVDGTPLPEKYPKIKVRDHVKRDAAAAPAILSYSADHDIGLIVLGTRGRRGVQRALLGSVAEEVVRHADRPVLTVHRREEDVQAVTSPPPIERILVPVDFSDHAREALRHAHAVAALYDARLDLLHVTEAHLHPAFYGEGLDAAYDLVKERKAEEELHAFYEDVVRTARPERELSDHAAMEACVAAGRPAAEIIRFAEERGSDLVVMSTHGLTGLRRFLMGSVTEKVVRHVPVPVFTVKAFGKPLVEPSMEEARETDS
jgi:nucleotide-binding universal stress UspA family protein